MPKVSKSKKQTKAKVLQTKPANQPPPPPQTVCSSLLFYTFLTLQSDYTEVQQPTQTISHLPSVAAVMPSRNQNQNIPPQQHSNLIQQSSNHQMQQLAGTPHHPQKLSTNPPIPQFPGGIQPGKPPFAQVPSQFQHINPQQHFQQFQQQPLQQQHQQQPLQQQQQFQQQQPVQQQQQFQQQHVQQQHVQQQPVQQQPVQQQPVQQQHVQQQPVQQQPVQQQQFQQQQFQQQQFQQQFQQFQQQPQQRFQQQHTQQQQQNSQVIPQQTNQNIGPNSKNRGVTPITRGPYLNNFAQPARGRPPQSMTQFNSINQSHLNQFQGQPMPRPGQSQPSGQINIRSQNPMGIKTQPSVNINRGNPFPKQLQQLNYRGQPQRINVQNVQVNEQPQRVNVAQMRRGAPMTREVQQQQFGQQLSFIPQVTGQIKPNPISQPKPLQEIKSEQQSHFTGQQNSSNSAQQDQHNVQQDPKQNSGQRILAQKNIQQQKMIPNSQPDVQHQQPSVPINQQHFLQTRQFNFNQQDQQNPMNQQQFIQNGGVAHPQFQSNFMPNQTFAVNVSNKQPATYNQSFPNYPVFVNQGNMGLNPQINPNQQLKQVSAQFSQPVRNQETLPPQQTQSVAQSQKYKSTQSKSVKPPKDDENLSRAGSTAGSIYSTKTRSRQKKEVKSIVSPKKTKKVVDDNVKSLDLAIKEHPKYPEDFEKVLKEISGFCNKNEFFIYECFDDRVLVTNRLKDRVNDPRLSILFMVDGKKEKDWGFARPLTSENEEIKEDSIDHAMSSSPSITTFFENYYKCVQKIAASPENV
ncbi:hypothetical protein QTN25_008023 [Entamoeba marina]